MKSHKVFKAKRGSGVIPCEKIKNAKPEKFQAWHIY